MCMEAIITRRKYKFFKTTTCLYIKLVSAVYPSPDPAFVVLEWEICPCPGGEFGAEWDTFDGALYLYCFVSRVPDDDELAI